MKSPRGKILPLHAGQPQGLDPERKETCMSEQLKLVITPRRAGLVRGIDNVVEALVRLQAPARPASRMHRTRPPLNIALVIDRSSSMQGRPLTEACKAATQADLPGGAASGSSSRQHQPPRRLARGGLEPRRLGRRQQGLARHPPVGWRSQCRHRGS